MAKSRSTTFCATPALPLELCLPTLFLHEHLGSGSSRGGLLSCKTLLRMLALVEQVVDQVGEDHPLVAQVGRAGDRSELAALLVLGQLAQRQLLFAAVHFVGAAVLDVLDDCVGKEGDRPEHLRPAQKVVALVNHATIWLFKK